MEDTERKRDEVKIQRQKSLRKGSYQEDIQQSCYMDEMIRSLMRNI